MNLGEKVAWKKEMQYEMLQWITVNVFDRGLK
jgi:hypothetical protein